MRTKKPQKKVAKKGKKTLKKNTTFKKLIDNEIKAVMAKNVETKQAYRNNGDSLVWFNSQIDSASDMQQLLPNIAKSVNDNGRIGDQIKAKSLTLSGYMRYAPLPTTSSAINTSTYSNIVARLMVVSLKLRPNYPDINQGYNSLNFLLKKGGTAVGFTGKLTDIYAPINTDLWTLHHNETHYISQDMLYQPSTASLVGGMTNMRDLVKFFNIKIPCKNKILKYDDNVNGGETPTNFGPVMVIGYAYLNGALPDSVSANLAVQYSTVFNYEDA